MVRAAGWILACACALFSAPGIAASPFDAPAVLRGTLGSEQVQLNLRPKTDAEEGFEGEYFVFGQSNKILVAGEVEGDDVFFEESENGSDVSGQWTGRLAGDKLSGEWQSADGKASKPFQLRFLEQAGKHRQ
ncbi:MAG TPA: hypothetical protein VEC01_12875 [Noviherbaspirillum sp.]|uniref:hypothetical protein n=1 Tax=Noviherbaspirillum sp. TaxID=1926288 RepID=UPI002D5171CC|nr:hypothetical protein [Noviherbaspirillum sp.]HYD96214.1 hypothetical protein [Noviherbaspirillum sp.]